MFSKKVKAGHKRARQGDLGFLPSSRVTSKLHVSKAESYMPSVYETYPGPLTGLQGLIFAVSRGPRQQEKEIGGFRPISCRLKEK